MEEIKECLIVEKDFKYIFKQRIIFNKGEVTIVTAPIVDFVF